MLVQNPPVTSRRAEKCIYCGAGDNLTDEHIVPFGLWGRLVFPDASCKDCAKKINIFETQVQQQHLGLFRQRSKIPLRKRRARDYKTSLSLATTDPVNKPAPPPIEISADDVPRDFILFKFWLPQIVIGAWSKPIEPWRYQKPEDWESLIDKFGNAAVAMGHYDNHMFCRLIAKIGHSFTLAFFDPKILEGFELLLHSMILSGTDNDHYLVGGDPNVTPAGSFLHELAVRNVVNKTEEFLLAQVRLFACLGTPTFYAVVAKRPLGSTTVTKDPVRL